MLFILRININNDRSIKLKDEKAFKEKKYMS